MRISKRVQYGIIAIVSIAIHSQNGSYVNVSDIAKKNNLPIKYLENIMSDLRINNLVIGNRGCKNGGYKLRKNPNDITLTEILNALDNTILGKNQSENHMDILNEIILDNINKSILDFSNNITLSTMIELSKSPVNI